MIFKIIKQFIILSFTVVAVYFLLNYHIIFFGNDIKFLKKSILTSSYTFFNAQNKSAEDILKIEELREDGIGTLLVKKGLLSQQEKEQIEYVIANSP